MYGLVNKAVHDLVVTKFGAEAWDTIRRRAGVESVSFVGLQPYPDAVTYRLVEAASETLGLPPAKVLEAFGEYWMTYTAREGYGELLDLTGGDFVSFLQNLHALHARIRRGFPGLQPPELRCTEVTSSSLRLHYHSHRPGLAPFVVGLLRGLGKRFGVEVSATLDRGRDEGHDHDEFVVQFHPVREG